PSARPRRQRVYHSLLEAQHLLARVWQPAAVSPPSEPAQQWDRLLPRHGRSGAQPRPTLASPVWLLECMV
ncbi:hypothetical protein, partial [Mesorhizobium sp. M7A.F.Ca.CA.004.11.2.1]|uniref:hypothetical protein n=1 Tax=Mesorhizobium sp. M7A.F.Ca.CA.004.11.2.1 TaxID=2496699 RepID=UPI0019CFF454